MELVGPDCSARQASGTRGLLLGFQVLLNLFKFFSQVWHFIVLSQIHSNHVAQSKSKQELEHDVGGEGEEGVRGAPAPARLLLSPWVFAWVCLYVVLQVPKTLGCQ